MKLQGKVAMVTGGARGIGRAICSALAADGAKLAVVDILEQVANEAASAFQAQGIEARAFVANVAKIEDMEKVVADILAVWGQVDILVNNAGITRDGLLVRMKEEDWDLVLAVNLKGTFNGIKAVARPMMKARTGKIVNVASVVGLIGNIGQANYSASKGGVIALTKTAARELALRNINVNAVAPGFIQTEMTEKLSEEAKQAFLRNIPLNRGGTPEDVAKAVRFLAGPESDYLTGQVLNIDGGMVM